MDRIISHTAPQDANQTGGAIDPKDLVYLDAERPKVEYLLEHGFVSQQIFMNDLKRIYRTYFAPNWTGADVGDIDRFNLFLRDLYAQYDQWKSTNPNQINKP